MEISLIYEEFITQIPVSFHVILKVTNKESVALSILGGTKLGLRQVDDFPKSPLAGELWGPKVGT